MKNERQRILDLVDQGILTSEEALILLENLVNQDETTNQTSNQTTNESEQTQEKAQQDAEMAAKNKAITQQLNGVNQALQTKQQALQQTKEQLTVLETLAELEPLSVEKNEQRQNLKQTLNQLTTEIEALKTQSQTLTEELNDLEKKRRYQWHQKLGLNEEWQESASETFEQLGQKIGDASSQLGSFVKSTVKTVTDNLDWKEINFKIPGLVTANFENTFEYTQIQPELLDIKVANGQVKLQTHDQDTFKVVAAIKLFGKMSEATDLAAFEARSHIEVNDDHFIFQVPNKRIQANLTIYVPEKTYQQAKIKLLNGDIMLSDLTIKDAYLKTTNGEITVDQIQTNLLDVENVNGSITVLKGQQKNVYTNTVNGPITLTTQLQALEVSSINGEVKATIANKDIQKIKTKIVNGTTKLAISPELTFDLNVSTRFGNIKNRLQNTEVISKDEQHKGDKKLTLKRQTIENIQNAAIDLNSTTGTILIKDIQE